MAVQYGFAMNIQLHQLTRYRYFCGAPATLKAFRCCEQSTERLNMRASAKPSSWLSSSPAAFSVAAAASSSSSSSSPSWNLPSSTSSYGNFQASATAPSGAAAASGHPISKSLIYRVEEHIEQAIFNCRFLTLMAVAGSLAGSVLCFFKGCWFVLESFTEYFQTCLNRIGTGKVILLLVEAVDVFLMGTVMLIFGMGVYELFVSSLEVPGGNCFASGGRRTTVCDSNLFGLFRLKERPKWLEIHSLDELKTKLGHVIVMILLVGMFEKSKKVPIHTSTDLLCFSASILLSSGCLYLLSKLHSTSW